MLTSPLLEGIPHGFSTHEGLGAGDILPGAKLVRVRQVHSPAVVAVDSVFGGEVPEADAIVTSTPNLALGIVTADCAPVLLADTTAGVIGAAHAGWRGAVDGVVENTVAAMEALGADRDAIKAAIGPCIAQSSYEVDPAFRERFASEDSRFFASGRKGHWQFDLPGYVLARLVRSGIAQSTWLGRDTYAEDGTFFSYRRSTHRQEDTGGRQISLIALR